MTESAPTRANAFPLHPVRRPARRGTRLSMLARAWLLAGVSGFASSLVAQQTLSLHEAVRLATTDAPQARVGGDRVALQRAQVDQAALRPNPRLYLQSEDLRPWDHAFSFVDSTENYGYVSQTVELDGKRGRRIAYAARGLARSAAEQQVALRQIAAAVANAYWTTAAADASVGEWQEQAANLDTLVRYQAERVQAGATAGVDLLRTQVERDRVLLSLAEAQRRAQAASIELARLAALPAARTAALADALEQERPVSEQPIAYVLAGRPDLLAAHAAVEEAHAELRLQHAEAVPNLDFLGGYKRNVGANTLYGGLQLDLPLFNRNQGAIAMARAGRQLAEDQLAAVTLAARAEIETALSDYNREEALVHATLPGMEARSQQNAAILRDAYRSGGADLLRYLDAERTLLETRLLAVETWSAYQRAAVALRLAYGDTL